MDELGKLKVTGVTLLSTDEYQINKEFIIPLGLKWWLRSPSSDLSDLVGTVYENGRVYYTVTDVDTCYVRPVLKCDLEALGIKPGEKLKIKNQKYIALIGNYLLKLECICNSAFRLDYEADDANIYDASDIKKIVETWYQLEFSK